MSLNLKPHPIQDSEAEEFPNSEVRILGCCPVNLARCLILSSGLELYLPLRGYPAWRDQESGRIWSLGGQRLAALFFHHFDLMGDLGRVNLSLIGFKPNLVVISSDSQGRDAIQELVQGEELHRI